MPHQHHRYHGIVRARDDDSPWAQFTKGAASVWNEANPWQNKEQSTIYKTVYKTMTSGWDGKSPLTTLTPDSGSRAENTAAAQNAATTTSSTAKHTTKTSAASSTPSATDLLVADSSSLPKSIAPTTASSIDSAIVVATDSPTPVGQTAQTTIASATPTTSAKAQESSGGGAAAKAGIVIGVLAGVFVVAAIVYFLFSRRRKQMEKQRLADDEKVNGPFGDHAAIPTTPSRAPRLSLRPVTQFLPNLNPHQQHPDRRASRGAAIAMVASPTNSRAPGQSAWERPNAGANAHPANPFGDNAERLHTPIPEEPSTPMDVRSPSHAGVAATTNSQPEVSPVSAVAGAGAVAGIVAGAGAVAGLTRKQSVRKDVPKPLDLTLPPTLSAVPPSPAGTEFSVSSVSPGQSPGPSASAAAIAAAGGPQTSTVHRVQLDFKPTLEDEMELRAGMLVRLLHEYDDGWALCIRLDRSEQGVVPRTCLSTRPVKPRPANGGPRGPPVNPQRGPNYHPSGRPMTPQGRPMTPQGGPGYARSESPMRPMNGGGRPQSPAGRPMSPYGGRPQSPANGRPMSPGPRSQSPGPRYQQGRPQSPNGMNRRMSPPGPSQISQEYKPGPPTGPVGRKPVPGQAY